jgi:hypothetical protein
MLAPRAPAAPPLVAPETRSGGYRIVVERLVEQVNVPVEFAPDPVTGARGGGAGEGSQYLYANLAVYPPPGVSPLAIEGLDLRLVGLVPGRQPVVFQSFPFDDANPELTGSWRTQIAAQSIPVGVATLDRLQGELVVYARAKHVTLDFPVNGPLPAVREAEGYRATLKDVRLRPGTLTFQIAAEWPKSVALARVRQETPDGISALTKSGLVLSPFRAGFSSQSQGGVTRREYTLTVNDLKEPPAKIRVEAIVRSGPVRRLPFTLRSIPLPEAIVAQAGSRGVEEDGPLDERHPLFAHAGGSLVVTGPAGAISVLLGLAPKETGGYGPWRWVEAPLDDGGKGVITHLRPGHYRVLPRWPGAAAAVLEVDVAAGKTAVLPAHTGAPRP